MKLGAEPKKVVILGFLLLVAAVVVYNNFSGSDVPQQAKSPARRPAAPAAPPRSAPSAPASAPGLLGSVSERPGLRPGARDGGGALEFRPSLKPKRPEDRPDPNKVDPTLRLDLLARLQNVKLEGGERSLFEFSQPKAPKVDYVKIKPGQPKPGAEPPKAEDPKPASAEPVKPPPPPITLKFYGFISPARHASGTRRAFFLDGEEIVVAAEGEMIQKRYKVVRIGVNSVVVEDVEHKHQQTLALEERQG